MTTESRIANDSGNGTAIAPCRRLGLSSFGFRSSFVIRISSLVIGLPLLLLTSFLCGCVSRSQSQLRQHEAYTAGQREAVTQQKPTVTFLGDVKNHSVPWAENLTLTRALLLAEYQALWDPHQISITRRGETYKINVKALLAGGEDPPLEPGDTIEVKR